MKYDISGLVAAAHTPMHRDFSLNLDRIEPQVEHFVRDKLDGLYVCGSNGEGPLLTGQERRAVAQAFVNAAKGRLPIIVQVGHNSLMEARELAAHAADIGADAVSAVPPSYFKVASLDSLLDCLAEIASAAPGLPFFYYHIPQLTGVLFDMVELLRKGGERIPNLAGIKYSTFTIFELQACLDYAGDRFTILFGSDQMLLSALCVGVRGAIGSTYNFAAPLYRRIIQAFEEGNMGEARRLQGLSVQMVRVFSRFPEQPAIKAVMQLVGVDCGPFRLPLQTLTAGEVGALKEDLERIGFFDWGRS